MRAVLTGYFGLIIDYGEKCITSIAVLAHSSRIIDVPKKYVLGASVLLFISDTDVATETAASP